MKRFEHVAYMITPLDLLQSAIGEKSDLEKLLEDMDDAADIVATINIPDGAIVIVRRQVKEQLDQETRENYAELEKEMENVF